MSKQRLLIGLPKGPVLFETRTIQNLPPEKERRKELVSGLNIFTVEYLKVIYKSLFNESPPALKKYDFVKNIAEDLTFSDREDFQEWFGTLPPLNQKILHRMIFDEYVPVAAIEKELGVSLVHQEKDYWRPVWHFNEGVNLDFLLLVSDNYDQAVLNMPSPLRKAFSIWLIPPPEGELSGCISDNAGPGLDNSLMAAEAYPLLCDGVRGIFADMHQVEWEKTVKSGFKKKELGTLKAASGFPSFNPDMAEYAPDSADLAARFMLCTKNYNMGRPNDGQDEIKNLVSIFFSEPKNSRKITTDRNYLEYFTCIDHLTRSPGYYFDNYEPLLTSRKTFHEILLAVARDGRWFDAGKLAEYIKINIKDFAFCYEDLEKTLRIKAESIELGGVSFSPRYDDIRVFGIMHYHALVKPLLKAYCYIFAALGILEITQEKPPLCRILRKKQNPISPYDSLKTIRITEFGRWCLGLTSRKPPKPAREYQAIADRELFLVTVQGSSLERTVYLDRIGQKLGEDRWRISPASFISDCDNKRQIEERITQFKNLIDPSPAPHWLGLFDKVISRAGIFDQIETDVIVFKLPDDRELTEELLQDRELRKTVLRAEGMMLVVPVKNKKKFFALLKEHGIAAFWQ